LILSFESFAWDLVLDKETDMSIYVGVSCHIKNTVISVYVLVGRLAQAAVTSICRKFSLCSNQAKTTALMSSQSQELTPL